MAPVKSETRAKPRLPHQASSPSMIAIANESYFLDFEGNLMPVRKDQSPPDLRYFKKQTQK